MNALKTLQQKIRSEANPAYAEHALRFFKTGPGQYGEGDRFLGIRVPVLRKISRQFKRISLTDTTALLKSEYHEERLVALLILVSKYAAGDQITQSRIVKIYLSHTQYINNWDLVDLSAHKIIGPYLENRDRNILSKLAQSQSLWERRIAILSTFHFIYQNDFLETLKISELLLTDTHDLIHKAVGWMLREVGKRDQEIEERFLQNHYRIMPRTMLRYAIEKFPEPLRQRYLKGEI